MAKRKIDISKIEALREEVVQKESLKAELEFIDAHLFRNPDTKKTRKFITEDNPSTRRILRICDLIEKVEAMGKLIEEIPTGEYGNALSNGCDSNGAWDCFTEALSKWRQKAALALVQPQGKEVNCDTCKYRNKSAFGCKSGQRCKSCLPEYKFYQPKDAPR